MSRMVSAMRRVSSAFMPATGSSSSSSVGSVHSARAISTRFWSPYESTPAGVWITRSRPRKWAISRTRTRWTRSSLRALGNVSALATQPVCIRWWRPSIRFSSTDRPVKRAMFWNVRPTPKVAISSGRRSGTLTPR